MDDFLNIGGYAWTIADQEYVESVGYLGVCFSAFYAVPLGPDDEFSAAFLPTVGYVCYTVEQLRNMFAAIPPDEPPSGGGGETPPPDDGGGGAVTDPGIPPLPPPPEIPPDPPPVVIPPPTASPPPTVLSFPEVYPGIQIGANGLPFLPGGTVAIRVFNGLGSFLGALLGTVFGGSADDEIKRLRYDVVNAVNAIWTAIKALKGVVDALARAVGAAIGTLHKIWHSVIQPILDHIKEITRRINAIINKVLKPYLDWMKRVRAIILAVYTKIILPILNVIQGIRKAVALLRLAHVPFAKKLDEKLARLEAKLIAPIQWLLARVNDHGGFINEIMSIQRVLQEPLFTRSLYSYQANLVNAWWGSQTVPRTAQQQQQADALHVLASSNAGNKSLDQLLDTGVYVEPFPIGPSTAALNELLQQGPQ